MTANNPKNAADAPVNGRSTCPECGGPVTQPAKGRARIFCKEAHKQAFRNRLAVRGKMLTGLALGWRVDRGSGPTAKAAFAQMCAMLDEWNADDREAGRPRADYYTGLLIEQGNYVDRKATHIHCTRRYQGCHGRVYANMRTKAREAGWMVEPGKECCPNCLDDPHSYDLSDVYVSGSAKVNGYGTATRIALRGGIDLGILGRFVEPEGIRLYYWHDDQAAKVGPFLTGDEAKAAMLAEYLGRR